METMKSKVNYFDISIDEVVDVVKFCKIDNSGIKDDRPKQILDYYKVTPKGSDKVHYLFTHEVE